MELFVLYVVAVIGGNFVAAYFETTVLPERERCRIEEKVEEAMRRKR